MNRSSGGLQMGTHPNCAVSGIPLPPPIGTEMRNWMNVQNYVSKAEQTPDVGVSEEHPGASHG